MRSRRSLPCRPVTLQVSPVTWFDPLVLAIFAVSALFGWVRGLAREAVTLVALFGGLVVLGVLGRPLAGLMGDGLALRVILLCVLFVLGFLAVHAGLEMVARRLIGAVPGRIDRGLGAGFGVLRGWFLVGLGYLTLTFYYGQGNLPAWVDDALFESLARGAAEVLDAFGIEGDRTGESRNTRS